MRPVGSSEELITWRLDVILDSAIPISWETVSDARLDLGPAGGQSAQEGHPLVNLYVNACERTHASAALDQQLSILLARLRCFGAIALRKSEVIYAGPALPPSEAKTSEV